MTKSGMPGVLLSRRPCKIKCTYNTLEYPSNGLNLPRWGIFGHPLTQRVKILQQQKISLAHHTSHITHHTAYIAYELGIMLVVLLDNSKKLILNMFTKYFFD